MSYYYYTMSCRLTGGESIGSRWYDEHIIGKIPIAEHAQLRCAEVHVGLRITDGYICLATDLSDSGGRYDVWRSASLAIEGADAEDYDSESHVPWDVITDLGVPDMTSIFSTFPREDPETLYVDGLVFHWTDRFPDDSWFIKSPTSTDGALRRAVVNFTDFNGIHHRYYAVPALFE